MPSCTKCGALVAPSLTLEPVCTDCGGVAPLYCRPVYAEQARSYRRIGADLQPNCRDCLRLIAHGQRVCDDCDKARRQRGAVEAVADSHLSNVAMPTYTELVEALRGLEAMNWLDHDPCDSEGLDEAKATASTALERLRGLL
ncbi:hypothetical protein [Xylophilus sp.]|uniref:hypothetical protein n=1 Tax=Xylophilus sp. TaxID=2653893 RepID=UPI0013BE3F91|nr:hypothetical protein [Xylophilus sp.]KAF1049303.1 MAG: hypothetical protein GAK38_00759 [Xylophilus sp.]